MIRQSAEHGQHAEQRVQKCQELPALAQTVLDVIHGAAHPLAGLTGISNPQVSPSVVTVVDSVTLPYWIFPSASMALQIPWIAAMIVALPFVSLSTFPTSASAAAFALFRSS